MKGLIRLAIRGISALLVAYASSAKADDVAEYEVVELPYHAIVDDDVIYLAGPQAIDPKGRVLVYVDTFYGDGRPELLRTQRCNSHGDECTLVVPRNRDNTWIDFSHDGNYATGVLYTDGVVNTTVLRRKKGGTVEKLFCCGQGFSVNSQGTVAGQLQDGSEYKAWLYDTARRDLPGLGGSSTTARAINDSGLVVGHSTTPLGETRAVGWRDGAISLLQTGIPDGRNYWSIATDVTPQGVAYGQSNYIPSHLIGARRAVRFENQTVVDLGVIGPDDSLNESGVMAVNSGGVAVGFSSNWPAEVGVHATIFSGSGKPRALLGLIPAKDRDKYIFEYAKGINDAGQIIVLAYQKDPPKHVPIRLDPVLKHYWHKGCHRFALDLRITRAESCDSQ